MGYSPETDAAQEMTGDDGECKRDEETCKREIPLEVNAQQSVHGAQGFSK